MKLAEQLSEHFHLTVALSGDRVCVVLESQLYASLDMFRDAILHGDAAHREWLRLAFEAFKNGDQIPGPSGAG